MCVCVYLFIYSFYSFIAGDIGLDPKGQIELKIQNLPNFELTHLINCHQLKLGLPHLDIQAVIHYSCNV